MLAEGGFMRTSYKAFLGAAILMAMPLLAGPAAATAIAVNNYSFETPGVGGVGGFTPCPITGWTCTPAGAGGIYNPVNTQYPAGANGLSGGLIVPDGSQAAYLNSGAGSLFQNTAATVALGTYTLNVFVGYRNDVTGTISGSIALTANNVVFATLALTAPAQGHWLDESLIFTTTAANSALFGQTLGIALVTTSNVQLNLDDVRLDFASATAPAPVPEPATLALFGFGMIALFAALRRRRSA
jgi:hypothetical protein